MDRIQGIAMKVQNVINTLQVLNIPATRDNMNYLLGCHQELEEIKMDLAKLSIENEKETNQNGTGNDDGVHHSDGPERDH